MIPAGGGTVRVRPEWAVAYQARVETCLFHHGSPWPLSLLSPGRIDGCRATAVGSRDGPRLLHAGRTAPPRSRGTGRQPHLETRPFMARAASALRRPPLYGARLPLSHGNVSRNRQFQGVKTGCKQCWPRPGCCGEVQQRSIAEGGRSPRMILAGKTHFPPFAPQGGIHPPKRLQSPVCYNPRTSGGGRALVSHQQ